MSTFHPGRALKFGSAPAVLEAGLSAIAHGQREMNLETLDAFDSSAVAVLLAWQRAAARSGHRLAFLNVPANLQSLIDLYGVRELLLASPSAAAS